MDFSHLLIVVVAPVSAVFVVVRSYGFLQRGELIVVVEHLDRVNHLERIFMLVVCLLLVAKIQGIMVFISSLSDCVLHDI